MAHEAIPLAAAEAGVRYTIVDIAGGRGLRDHLRGMGLREGVQMELVAKADEKGPVTMLLGDSRIAVGSGMARKVKVKEAVSAEKLIRVAVAGNPNSGKTTIFNNLTGARQHVGNYPGVTVEKKEGTARHGDRTICFTDLPGTYSLTPYSPEELVARRFLLEEKPDMVVDVVDASNLERNLYLATQLMELGVNLVLVFNMSDLAKARGQTIDHERLSGLLGVPIVPTVGNRNRGTKELLETIVKVADGTLESRPSFVSYGTDIDPEIEKIRKHLDANPELEGLYPTRWLALKLLEGDDEVREMLRTRFDTDGELDELVAASAKHLHMHFGDEPEALIADHRYGFISGACQEAVARSPERRHNVSDEIDKVVTNRWVGLPIFAAVMFVMFKAVFALGDIGIGYVETGVEALGGWLGGVLPQGSLVQSLIVDGIIAGVGNVIVFLPLVVLLFLIVAFLEDTGYMARAAFVIDRIMHAVGLHGRSFIPMLLGFGCSVPAVMATRTLASRRDRLTTMLVVPLMSCGAKLPVYLLFAGVFFGGAGTGSSVVWSLYMLGTVMAVLMALLFRKTLFRGPTEPFVMELPPYRMPTLKGVLIHMWERAWLYIKRAGTIIFLFSIVMWVLLNLPRNNALRVAYDARIAAAEQTGESEAAIAAIENEKAAEVVKRSIAGSIGRSITPALKPLGLDDWKIGTALLSGLVAKEVVVSTIGQIYAVGQETDEESESLRDQIAQDPFYAGSKLKAYTLMVFVLLYVPCLVAMAVIKRESGSWLWALFAGGYTTALAYVVSLLVYQGGRLLGLG